MIQLEATQITYLQKNQTQTKTQFVSFQTSQVTQKDIGREIYELNKPDVSAVQIKSKSEPGQDSKKSRILNPISRHVKQ